MLFVAFAGGFALFWFARTRITALVTGANPFISQALRRPEAAALKAGALTDVGAGSRRSASTP